MDTNTVTTIWTDFRNAIDGAFLSAAGGSILGALAGGYLTSRAEKRKLKIENVEKIKAPYCALLEESKESKIYDIDEWFEILNKPIDYLEVNKIIYLSDESKKLLNEYEKKLNDLKNTLKREYFSIKGKYEHYLIIKINDKFNYNNTYPELNYFNGFENKLKLSILNKNIDFQISTQLSHINYYEKDFRGICGVFTIDIEQEEDYIEDNDNPIGIYHAYLRDKKEELLKVLWSIDKNKEIEYVKSELEKTKSNELKDDLLKKVNKMIEISRKEIDKVTKIYKK